MGASGRCPNLETTEHRSRQSDKKWRHNDSDGVIIDFDFLPPPPPPPPPPASFLLLLLVLFSLPLSIPSGCCCISDSPLSLSLSHILPRMFLFSSSSTSASSSSASSSSTTPSSTLIMQNTSCHKDVEKAGIIRSKRPTINFHLIS